MKAFFSILSPVFLFWLCVLQQVDITCTAIVTSTELSPQSHVNIPRSDMIATVEYHLLPLLFLYNPTSMTYWACDQAYSISIIIANVSNYPGAPLNTNLWPGLLHQMSVNTQGLSLIIISTAKFVTRLTPSNDVSKYPGAPLNNY